MVIRYNEKAILMINTKQHSMYSYSSVDENGKKRTS